MPAPVTVAQRQAVISLLNSGLSRDEVAARLGLKPGQVSAIKAHISMGTYSEDTESRRAPRAGAEVEPAMQGLGATKNRLRNLLKYTDELLSFNEKVTFDLSREPYPHFHEFQVAALDGVETALDDETWLQIH